MAILELTLISASISAHVHLDLEPKDTYATIRFAKEQRCTKTTHDHGRSPVWNETFAFSLGDQDVPKFIFVQMFAIRSDTDEPLGVARIPISTTGKTEASLHVLVSPDKGETGTLKAAWRWKSIPETNSLSSSDVTRDHSPALYPPAASTYDEVTSAMAKLAVHKGQGKEPYHPSAYASVSSAAYPPNYGAEERSTFTSEPYPPPTDLSKTSYPPYTPNTDSYPPYPEYQKPSSSSESHFPTEKEAERSPSSTTRGLGDTKDKGHHSHMPYGYAPPGMYGSGYAPPGMYGSGYPPPPGYPSQPGYPSPYGPPPGGYPPAPAYPPAPHSIPPAPYGYPPSANPYPPQPYPPYGYPPQAPYPAHAGHGSYAPGMYVGHSSHGKHSKHYKHHKMPKHSMYHYGHPQPHYGHYKHKKHKGFGKGYKFKKFKGFKKFKF